MDDNDTQLVQGNEPETDATDNQLVQDNEPETNSTDSQNSMASLLEESEGIDFPTQGEIRNGIIASLTPGQVLVSVGTKSEGIISGREYEAIPQEVLSKLEVGQAIPVYVLNPEDSSGNVVLSLTRALEEQSWLDAEALLESKSSYHSTIAGYNKGGLIVQVGGLRGFVPASQVSLTRRSGMGGETPEQRFGSMVGEEIDICVIEVDRERRRLILSERAASTETRETIKERVIEDLQEGVERVGRVTSLAEFGAFVNISGADGLVHLSEISWDRIQHPSEVLKVGQEVKVKIISVDREKKRIGLSIRQLQDDPWIRKAQNYQVGQLIEATITRLTKFGAFARIEDDVEGLIHISEISEKRIEHPKEVLKEGDLVTLRVIKVDPVNHRIGLSLRRVESMAYADMDWQSLEEVLEDTELDTDLETPVAEVEIAEEVTEPDVEITEPDVEVTEPDVEATEPDVEATESDVEATEPAVEATVPDIEATEPAVEATEPAVEATEPDIEVTEPAVEATEPDVEETKKPADEDVKE